MEQEEKTRTVAQPRERSSCRPVFEPSLCWPWPCTALPPSHWPSARDPLSPIHLTLSSSPAETSPPEAKTCLLQPALLVPACHRGPFYFAVSPLAWCPCALRVGSPLEDWPATILLRRHPGLCWTPSVDQLEPSRVKQELVAI